MTCREEVLVAFEALNTETLRVDFSPSEILARMRAYGSTYKDSTIRTHVTAHMTEDGTLVRSAPGRYRLARHRTRPAGEPSPAMNAGAQNDRITEDQVKAALKDHLEADGWTVTVAWGRERRTDIDARREGQRVVIEAKGEAPAGPQQVNYFLGALGELVQRMDDSTATYGVALPDHRQYRGLVDRLPSLARERLGPRAWFVDGDGTVTER